MAGFLASHSAHMKRSIDVSLGTLFASSGAEDWIAKSMRYREEASQLSRARIQEPSSPRAQDVRGPCLIGIKEGDVAMATGVRWRARRGTAVGWMDLDGWA